MVDRIEIKNISQVELGEFVRLDDVDNQGKFHYTGKVINIDKDKKFFEMQCIEGLFGFFISDKNKLSKGDKPTGWDKFEKDSIKFKQEKKDKLIKSAPVIKTKKELVSDLVASNPTLTEKKLLKLAIAEIGGDENNLKMFLDLAILKQKN